jgi:acyl-CoA reductase-like NAD-dependent aldehyde dehydrogenase
VPKSQSVFGPVVPIVIFEDFEVMQGFHAGWRESAIGGADGKHGIYEFTQTRTVYIQRTEG